MITEFVELFNAGKYRLEKKFTKKHPDNYKEIVEAVVSILGNDSQFNVPDPTRVHEIDDGEYQGTLVYVIAAVDYQPSEYWYVKVSYGSCSGCDTLEGIREYSDEPPTKEQVNKYMTLALHIVQGLKKMGNDE